MVAWAGIIFAVLAGGVVLFQLALALGAPWGHLAMGGRFPGRFPPALRVAAVVQAGIVAATGWLAAAHAGLTAPVPPGWTLWVLLGLSALSAVMNLATPSIPERRLWGPVTVIMLICVIRVIIG